MADEWQRARLWIADALAFIRSRESAAGAAGTTLESSLADAINRLDSSQVDGVAAVQDGTPEYLLAPSGVSRGELQRIQDLRTALLGPDGLIESLKDFEPPSEESSV